jgi:glycosyltransferase involved in cell wall biosynthesis
LSIKILHIITRMEQGGAPWVVLNLIKRLDPLRYKSLLVSGYANDPSKDLIPKAREMGIAVETVHHLVREVNPVKDLLSLYSLVSIIKKNGCEVVHTHTSKAGILGRLAAWFCGVKVIVHSTHGTIFHGYFSPLLLRFFVLVEKFTAKFTDRIICLSRKEIDEYLEEGIGRREQFTAIYNGLDLSTFEMTNKDLKEIRKGLDIEDKDYVGATIGRLTRVKGQRYLIEALPLIKKEIPNIVLLIAGDGEDIESLKSLAAASHVSSCVRFLGHREDIADILACVDCFYLTSLNEGFGIVLLEAMAMRKPIIATEVGGIPEVIINEETGILVPPGDPQAIAQATLELYHDPRLRERMGLSGYSRLKSIFGIDNHVRSTEILYEDLLKEKRSCSYT